MRPPTNVVDVGSLGVDGGALVLLRLAVRGMQPGEALAVHGDHPDLTSHLRAWCSAAGHRFDEGSDTGARAFVTRGDDHRWTGAVLAASSTSGGVDGVAALEWGLARRGSWVEAGGPVPAFRLHDRTTIWSDSAGRLYERAVSSQWDPETAIPWNAPPHPDPTVETAICRIMSYLVENENAALVVPARFLGQVHPHFVEVQHVLAAQVADEARHAHVFARRICLHGDVPTLSSAAGRQSLQTLLDEPDFATATFLLGVLGEGTFLSLLSFLEQYAPDDCTRTIAALVRSDEARHVAFGLSHLERHAGLDPTLLGRLAAAVERRSSILERSGGLDEDVYDSLVIVAGGGSAPAQIERGWVAVAALLEDMQRGREARVARLGFSPAEAHLLSSQHTQNFM